MTLKIIPLILAPVAAFSMFGKIATPDTTLTSMCCEISPGADDTKVYETDSGRNVPMGLWLRVSTNGTVPAATLTDTSEPAAFLILGSALLCVGLLARRYFGK